MEVKAGYKQTEVGIIPDDWHVGRVSDLVHNMKSGLSRRLQGQDIGIPVLTSGNIQNNKLVTDELKYWYIVDPQGSNTNDYVLDDGDILLCFINSMAQIGKPCIFRDIGRPVIYTTNMFRIVVSEQTVPEFAFFLFSTTTFQETIQTIAKPAVNQASFTKPDFLQIRIPLPPTKAEQETIAEALSDADALIEAVEQLLTKKRQVKQGAMSELLAGKTRLSGFSGEWNSQSFDDVLLRINAKAHQILASDYQDVGLYPVVDQGKQPIIGYSDRQDKRFKCPEGGVIVFGDHTCIIKFVDFDFLVGADGTQILKAKDGQHTHFHAFQLQHKGIMPTGYNRHFKFLKEYEFVVPPLPEQTAIAEILSDMDAEITALEGKLVKARQVKAGMMSELLTGKIRLV
jgi:type I restriction enzyme S subunit